LNESTRSRPALLAAALVGLQASLTAVAALVAALFIPHPAAVFLAAAVAGGVLTAWTVHRWQRGGERARRALRDGVQSFRDADFSMRLAVTRQDELGELMAVYNQMADALREGHNEIYQRELLLDTILQGTPVAIILTGQSGRVVFANRSARELLGTGGRLEGALFDDLVAQAPAQMREALEGGDALFTVGRDGEEETYRLARRSFHLNTQRHTLFMIERLTPELRRREVEVWKKAIRVMNHELNNSLAPIRSLVHSARLVLGRPEHAHRLEVIFETLEDRATHLSEFLEGYARFARLPRPNPREVGWREFLEGVRGMCAFRLEGSAPAAPGWFDPTQMQQVLINLVKNACESGSPPEEIALSVHRAADGGSVLRVMDRGRGMDEEVMGRALLPFYSSKASGTGLGLPLCREILEAHGGRLRLQSRTGGGLEVTCWLPGRPGWVPAQPP
jgi:nitrogen fixation/metabolism regulation signal transduction histidine kinase